MAEAYWGPRKVNGLRLEMPLMNGAGPIKTLDQVKELATVKNLGAIVLGSITVEPREGNKGVTFYAAPDGSFTLNSKGLPNPGLGYYLQHVPVMLQLAADSGKQLIVSLAGFSKEDYRILAGKLMRLGVKAIELNLSCPNIKGKTIICDDLDLTGETVDGVQDEVGPNAWVSAKLSADLPRVPAMAELLNSFPVIKAVVSTNTLRNSFAYDELGQPAIGPNDGLGGLAGRALKTKSLGQVVEMQSFLRPDIAQINVGGIYTHDDAVDSFGVGAEAMQITSAFIVHGSEIFTRVRGAS